MTTRSTALTIAAALAIATGACAQGDVEPANPLFELLDRLDPLDARELPFVCVSRLRQGRLTVRYGWQLGAAGNRHRLRYLDLGRETVTTDARTRVDQVPLTDAVATVLERVRALQDRDGTQWFLPSESNPMHPQGLAVMLARACRRRGMSDLADQLLAAAPDHGHHLANDLYRRLLIDQADPQVGWRQLLDRHELLVMTFGEDRSDNAERRVNALRDVIARLAAQTTSRAERILIDDPWLDGNVKFDSGPMSPPEPVPPAEQRPLDRLLAEGLAVVPELMELLDDTTMTRSLHYTTKFGGFFGVNPVGDQAHAALVRLVGESPVPSNLRSERRAAWQRYFDEHADDTLRELAEQRLRKQPAAAVRHYLAHWPDGIGLVLEIAAQAPSKRPATGVASVLVEDPRWQQLAGVQDLVRQCLADETIEHWHANLAEKALAARVPGALVSVTARWRARDLRDLKPIRHDEPDAARTELRLLMRHGDATIWQSIREATASEAVRQRCAQILLDEPELLSEANLLAEGRAADLAAAQSAVARLLADMQPLAETYAIPTPGGFVELHDLVHADSAALALATLRPDDFPYQPIVEAGARHRQLPLLRQLLAR